MRVALYQPDIPQNTGTILRMAACFGVPVDLIGPAGFDIRDRALKRAGLDYLAQATLVRHESYDAFIEGFRGPNVQNPSRLVLVTAHGDMPHTAFNFAANDVLLMGRESAGVPDHVHQAANARIYIPMVKGLRSLNVAVSAGIVLGEALRQIDGYPSVGSAAE